MAILTTDLVSEVLGNMELDGNTAANITRAYLEPMVRCRAGAVRGLKRSPKAPTYSSASRKPISAYSTHGARSEKTLCPPTFEPSHE